MLSFAAMPTLDLWYLHLPADQLLEIAIQLEAEVGVRAPKLAPTGWNGSSPRLGPATTWPRWPS